MQAKGGSVSRRLRDSDRMVETEGGCAVGLQLHFWGCPLGYGSGCVQ